MSAPIMHIAVGMSFPFLACLPSCLKLTSKKLLIVISLMILCGLAAIIPDSPRYFMSPAEFAQLHYGKSFQPIPRYSPEVNAIFRAVSHHSPYINLFAFHGFLDTHYAEDRGFKEGGLAVSFMFLMILFAARAAILRNEKEICRAKQDKA